MAIAFISEYTELREDATGLELPVPREPPVAVQAVTYTTSAQSAQFNARTRYVRIIADAKAHFSFGGSPVATANDPYLPVDSAEYFGVNGFDRVAFYDGSS